MEIVEPIRDDKQLKGMSNYLKGKNLRDYTLFILGINSALRISDLLKLKIEDVRGKDRVTIREQKTGKSKDFPLSDICKKAIENYIKKYSLESGYLFTSRKGQYSKPIGRVWAWKVINEAARHVGIDYKIGTQSLRKTFGYWAFKRGYALEKIQKLLNHSSPGTTLTYIGITKDELDEVYIKMNLGY